MPDASVRWKPHTIAKHALSIDLIDGVEISEASVAEQDYVIQNHGPAQLVLRVGSAITLDWWRDQFGSRALAFQPIVATTVCGREGRRQEVTVPETRAVGSFRGSDGSIGHMSNRVGPRVHVAVAGTTTAGSPFVLAWNVDADQRDALRADEDHFLASIRCR